MVPYCPFPRDVRVRAFSDTVVQKVPKVKGYRFFLAENRVALVDPQGTKVQLIRTDVNEHDPWRRGCARRLGPTLLRHTLEHRGFFEQGLSSQRCYQRALHDGPAGRCRLMAQDRGFLRHAGRGGIDRTSDSTLQSSVWRTVAGIQRVDLPAIVLNLST